MCDCKSAREGGERHLVASDYGRKRQATACEADSASLTGAPTPIYVLTVEIAPDRDPYRVISQRNVAIRAGVGINASVPSPSPPGQPRAFPFERSLTTEAVAPFPGEVGQRQR